MAQAPRPSFEDCLARVAAAGRVSRSAALQLLEQVHDRAEQMRLTGAEDPHLAAASELAAKAQETARADRLDAIRNATKRAGILARVTGFDNAEQVLRDTLHGSNVGGRENVQSEWLGRSATTNAAIDWQLRKAGVQQAAITGQLDAEVARALWAKNEGAEPAKDVSGPAKAMADAYHPALDAMRNLQNSHGARIGDAPDYVMHTWHDPLLLRRGGRDVTGHMDSDAAFARWWQFTEPKLAEKTFEDIELRDGESMADARLRFGRSFFNAVVSGIHMTPTGAGGFGIDAAGEYVPPSFEGTSNIARRVSQERVAFWQDADAWSAYNARYGRFRSIYEGVQHSVDQASRNVALMDKFGTNPAGNLNQIARRILETYRNSDLDGARKFQAVIPKLQNVMARLDGSANIPIESMWHSLGENARAYYNMTSLGGVGITHFASVWATVPTELRQHGIGAAGGIGNVGNVVQMLLRGRGPEERQAILSDLGAYAGGYVYNVSRNWNMMFEPGNTLMGRVSAMQSLFMKATGIHWVFDTVRAGVREAVASNLGRQTERAFGELDPHLQQMLGKYGIGDYEWEQLRTLENLPTWEGRKYITPKDALRTEDGQKLADKLLMYYHDAADHSVVVPGVRERAALYGAMRPGDPRYEMWRLLTQFKIWPIAAMNQVVGREIHMGLNARDVAWGLGLTVAMSTLAGYTRMAINDAVTGKPLRDPTSPATMLAGLAQGGGLGIFGDLVFGEVNRLGSSGIAALGGPAASDLDTLARIYGRWRTSMRTGQKNDPWPELAQFAVRHVPFANLSYLKGSLDYLLWFHLFEAMSPGYWERMNRRMQVEQGRTASGYTPGGGVPYGVPGVYMRNQAGQSFGLLGQR
jgi:hypothetical protein